MEKLGQELRAELDGGYIGPALRAELEAAIDRSVKDYRFPPRYYGAEVTWDPGTDPERAGRNREELLQDAVGALLETGGRRGLQLSYLAQRATSHEHLARLMNIHIKRVLESRLPKDDPTPRLLARARTALARPPFVGCGMLGGRPAYRLGGGDEPLLVPPNELQLRRAASRVSQVPRLPEDPAKRRSPVYPPERFDLVLQIIAEQLPVFTISHVRTVLNRVLSLDYPIMLHSAETTDAPDHEDEGDGDALRPEVARALGTEDEGFAAAVDEADTDSDAAVGKAAAEAFLDGLQPKHLELLAVLDRGLEETGDIAVVLGVSGQSVRNWTKEIQPRMEKIRGLPPGVRLRAMRIVRSRLPREL